MNDTTLTRSSASLGRLELVNNGSLEFSCGNPVLEKDIELAVRSSLRLGETEVGPDNTEKTGSAPEVTRLGSPVPGSRVEHVRVEDTDNDTTNVVQVSGEDNSLGSQSGRAHLGNEGVANGTNGNVVDESEDNEKGSNSPSGTRRLLDCAEDTGEEHDRAASDLSPDVNITTTEWLHKEPRRDGSDTSDNKHDQVERRSSVGSETGRDEEVGGHSHERGSGNGLNEPDDTGNLSSTTVDTLEAIGK